MRATLLLVLLAGCSLKHPADVPDPDASPSAISVGGSVAEMWPNNAVELSLTAGTTTESLIVTANGPFTFKTKMSPGDSYVVSVKTPPDGHTCTVDHGSGDIVDSSVSDVGVRCRAVDIALSIPDRFQFSADTATYDVPLSILGQEVGVTVTSAVASNIRVGSVDVASGTTITQSLSLGKTSLTVDVVIAGFARQYTFNFDRGARAIRQLAYLKPLSPKSMDWFGYEMSYDGELIAVGEYGDDSGARTINGDPADRSMPAAGSVVVYRRDADEWMVDAYLKADNADMNDGFGSSVSLSGNVLAVGAPGEASASRASNTGEDDNSAAGAGAVYIFERTAGEWKQTAYLKAFNGDAGDGFGNNVVLRGDDLYVSAPGEDSNATWTSGGDPNDNSLQDSGAVYQFHRTPNGWQRTLYIKACAPKMDARFGWNANHGSPFAFTDDGFAIGEAGHVFRAVIGVQLYLSCYPVTASDYIGGALAFGRQRLIAPSYSGTFLYTESGNGAFAYDRELTQSIPFASDAVSANARGDLTVLGEPTDSGNGKGIDPPWVDGSSASGGALLFYKIDLGNDQRAYIKASNADADDRFGRRAILSGDGLAVSAPWEDSAATGVHGDQLDNSVEMAGAVYVFH
jgi:hypothetical protein